MPFPLQVIFPTQGSNMHLLHQQADFLFTTEPPGKPSLLTERAGGWNRETMSLLRGYPGFWMLSQYLVQTGKKGVSLSGCVGEGKLEDY